MKKENIKIQEHIVSEEKTYVGVDTLHNITVTGNNKQAVITRLAEAYRSALQALLDGNLI